MYQNLYENTHKVTVTTSTMVSLFETIHFRTIHESVYFI